jgi:hypothetical protein
MVMKSVVLLFLFFVATNVFSQVVLTYKYNAPLLGDTIITQEISLISPGNEGSGQVWDFSALQYTGEKNVSFLSRNPVQQVDGLKDYTAVLNDKGYEYFYKLDENSSEILGLVNKDLSFVLSDPILKMKYPIMYGTNFTDEFNGTGINKSKSGIAISGDYTLEANASGTIILHDRIIKDVLRLKVVENKLQINPCNIYQIKTTSYYWYAPAARYPLLGMSTREVKSNGLDLVVTNTSFINQQMCNSGILLAGTGVENQDASEISLILYPNPFIGTLYYNYFLRKQLPITIELVDMTGKTIISLTKEQMQTEGFHTGELDAVKHNLKMGVYYFRFTLGDKVLVSKVVKM